MKEGGPGAGRGREGRQPLAELALPVPGLVGSFPGAATATGGG